MSNKIKLGLVSAGLSLGLIGGVANASPTIEEQTMEAVEGTIENLVETALTMFFSVLQFILPFLVGIGVFYLAWRWIMGRIR